MIDQGFGFAVILRKERILAVSLDAISLAIVIAWKNAEARPGETPSTAHLLMHPGLEMPAKTDS